MGDVMKKIFGAIIVVVLFFSCELNNSLEKITISSDKCSIVADGKDSAIITAEVPDTVSSATFYTTRETSIENSARFNGAMVCSVIPVHGVATVELTATNLKEDEYVSIIKCSTDGVENTASTKVRITK